MFVPVPNIISSQLSNLLAVRVALTLLIVSTSVPVPDPPSKSLVEEPGLLPLKVSLSLPSSKTTPLANVPFALTVISI